MKPSLFTRIGALLLGLMASAAPAQTVAITGGTVALGDGSEPIEGGTVVIQDGRIVAAGRVSAPPGAQIVDATGKWVTPGLIAGFSRIGLVEVEAVDNTNDIQAGTSPFSAAIDVVPSVNPRASTIAINRTGGVTRAIVAPGTGRSIFAGQGAVIDLGADMDPITRGRAFQFVELGESGAGGAGGSRAAAHVLFRNALREARDISRFSPGISGGGSARREPRANDQREFPLEEVPNNALLGSNVNRPQDVLLTRFDAAALVPVLTGAQLLLVHVERASDILQVLGLKREFPRLRLVLVGASEGWTVAERIAAAGVPVIASALNDLPASFEQLAATQSNFARMQAAGVKVSMGMINDEETRQVRLSRHYAGNLVALRRVPGASGLTWGQALAAITSGPAEAMGMGGELGSLRAGRRADVVLWDGDPLENNSIATMVMIDGVQQPLDNRQTKLRDRYKDPVEGQLPNAYKR
jgi:imidazolonepropionase-like amidohydrolase